MRTKTKLPMYEVVQPMQRWRLINGQWYRDTVVRMADGSLRLYGIKDEVVA